MFLSSWEVLSDYDHVSSPCGPELWVHLILYLESCALIVLQKSPSFFPPLFGESVCLFPSNVLKPTTDAHTHCVCKFVCI